MIRLADVCDYWSDHARAGAEDGTLGRYTDALPLEYLDVIRDGADIVRDWHLLPQQRWSFTHGDRVDNVPVRAGRRQTVRGAHRLAGHRCAQPDVRRRILHDPRVDTDLRREIEDAADPPLRGSTPGRAAATTSPTPSATTRSSCSAACPSRWPRSTSCPTTMWSTPSILALLRHAALCGRHRLKSVAAVRNVLSALSIR